MQDEASMDRGLLYNSKKGRLVDEIFQSLLTILLTEEVAEETEDLKTHVGNRSTHTRGGKLAIRSLYPFNHNWSTTDIFIYHHESLGTYATRLDLMNDATWLEILRQTITEGESLNLPTIWSDMAGCQEVLTNMLEYESEISDTKVFSSKMDGDAYEDLETRISCPLDMRTIESRINSGWYTADKSGVERKSTSMDVDGNTGDTQKTDTIVKDEKQVYDKDETHSNSEEKGGKKVTNTKGGGPAAFAEDMRTVFNNYLQLEEKTQLYIMQRRR